MARSDQRIEHAASKLRDLIEARTGCRIEADEIKALLASDWQKLSLLAHAAHDEAGAQDAARRITQAEVPSRLGPASA